MRTTKTWWSAWIGLELLSLSSFAAAASPSAAAAAATGDWFATDCSENAETHPVRPMPLLLRVLTAPHDDGQDAIVIRTPDGWLYAPRSVYEALALPPPGPPLRHAGEPYYALDRVPGLRFAVDPCRQVLSLDRSSTGDSTHRQLWRPPPPARAQAEPGAYVQTQAQYLHAGAVDDVSALIDGGLFSTAGLGQLGLLYGDGTLVRLDTRWTRDDPQRLTRLTLGDAITRGGAFGRSLRFGGVQWGREFALRPDLVTFPLPEIGEAAALPSAVDVYVDNTLRARDTVPAGPFQLSEVPVLSGAGEIRLVITDLLGRSRIVRYAFYAAPELLRQGLSDYTFEAGFERRNYGRDSLDYGPGFSAGTWRYGVSDRLTVEVHAEASAHLRVFGAGYSLLLPWIGVLSSGVAQGGGDSDGGELFVTLDRQGRRWSYNAQYLAASEGFLRLGETEAATLRRSLLTSTWRVGNGASLSVGWFDDQRPDGRIATLNAGYAQQLRAGLSLSLGATADLRGDDADSVLLTLAYSFSPSMSTYAYAQRSDAGTIGQVGVLRNPLHELDWSARATAQAGLVDRVSVGGDYRSTRGALHADFEDGDQDALRLGVDTSLVALGRDLAWTRPLTGPFALVETETDQAIHVQFENRRTGSARAGAPLLIPNLRPYQANRISVTQADFGIEQRLDSFERKIEAPGYGGVRVRFVADSHPVRRIELRLPDGRAVPAGSDIAGGAEPAFVGLRGEAVFGAAAGRHRLQVSWSDGECVAQIDLHVSDTLLLPPLALPCLSASEPGLR